MTESREMNGKIQKKLNRIGLGFGILTGFIGAGIGAIIFKLMFM